MRKLTVPSLVVVVLTAATTVLRAECPLPAEIERTRLSIAPIRVHEWGVWRLGTDGRVASLEALARESPPFVHRAADVPGLPLGPSEPMVACEKPVIFVHSDVALDLTITVRFPQGRPWLHYPSAVIGLVDGDRAVRFAGQVLPESSVSETLATSPTGHWWTHLRTVGASPFVSAVGSDQERFLFYDGETRLEPGFRRRRQRLEPIAHRTDAVAFSLDGDRAARLDLRGMATTSTPLVSKEALVEALRALLVSRGLTEAEARSLVDTWRPNLVNGAERRVIWLLPRASYDAMLPIEIFPRPTELVRVGVVIQHY